MVDEYGAFDVVTSVERVDLDVPVYDLDVERTHNFVAEGIVTHNSIYKFRGADFRNLMRFEEVFPESTVIVLDQNYRSTQNILDAANAVIANNAARRPKHLWTEQVGGELITRYHAEDEHDESRVHHPRDHAPRRQRGLPLRRRRRLLPHQRAEPRGRRGVRARGRAVPRSSAA